MFEEAIVRKRDRFKTLCSTDLLIRHQIYDVDGGSREVYEIGEVRRMVGHLNYLESSVQRIAKTKDKPVGSAFFGGRNRYWMSSDATALWHALRNVHESPKDQVAGRRLNPWLELGLHLANKWEPRLRHLTVSGLLDMRDEYARRMLTHIVYVIRRACRTPRFKAWVKNRSRVAEDNYKSLVSYMLRILRVCSRPHILRVDLYFEGDAREVCESEEAERAYNKFLRNLSEGKIVDRLLGYIGKREDGLERRIHFHVLVVVNGNKHQQTHNLTEKLGRYWVDECVGSPALSSYKNCYERKGDYQFNCLGLLHYTDDRMLMGLREALEYLCKEHVHVLVRAGRGKNLRKGQPPRLPRDGSRPGAPRKYGNDVSLAELILLTKPRSVHPRRFSWH